MRNVSRSPSSHSSSRGSRSSSPYGVHSFHSPSSDRYYSVPNHLVGLLAFFLLLNVIFLSLTIKQMFFIIPLIFSILCTYTTLKKIDGAALVQVNEMKSSLSREQVSEIIRDTNSPFVDNHVRAKLIQTTKRSRHNKK